MATKLQRQAHERLTPEVCFKSVAYRRSQRKKMLKVAAIENKQPGLYADRVMSTFHIGPEDY